MAVAYAPAPLTLNQTDPIRDAFDESAVYFKSPLQQFQYYDKYARFNHDLGRRETWVETVDRAVDFLAELSHLRLDAEIYNKIRTGILEMRVMPSMRLLAMAGPAARRDNSTIYNCSAIPVLDIDSFCEALLISMSGCGVGFSVERQFTDQLPKVKRQKAKDRYQRETIVVEDSQRGWSDALRRALTLWWEGYDCIIDYSLVRPAGAVLMTKGGRASGPEPLRDMLSFARARILARQGKKLRPIDAHDIMCAVGNAAVSGGMRRTAMLSLFDHDDLEMRLAKHGDFDKNNAQRWNANNSAVLPTGSMSQRQMIEHVLDMYQSERGEPGIFSRDVALTTMPNRRSEDVFLVNPCGEIVLRPFEFCNLSIAVARPDDDLTTLSEKVELATIIGTIQSMATHFPYLRDEWRRNAEEERLLGVDITGQLDCPAVQRAETLATLKQVAIMTNRWVADALGINRSVSITCVKPSGNSSQLLDCSSGLHARWAPYYIRNVRVSAHGPMFKVLREAGVPMDPENGQTAENANTWVVHFPVMAPVGSITRHDRSAIEQCEYWKKVKVHWTEHNPSVTITYRPDEELDILRWIWDNRKYIGGMAFLPAFDAKYDQLPYVEISQQEYERLVSEFPPIDFSRLVAFEAEDMTEAAQTLACMSGVCEL